MKTFILTLLLVFCTTGHTTELVEISRSIIIKENIEVVFNHVKNTMNDATWRSEVNSMETDGPFQIGTTFTEDAHIGLRKNFITKTTLLELIDNQKAFYVTPSNAKYFLSSLRTVKRIDDYETLFTYTVKFDLAMSKETLGANLPASVLEFSYGLIMDRYLKNLENYLTH